MHSWTTSTSLWGVNIIHQIFSLVLQQPFPSPRINSCVSSSGCVYIIYKFWCFSVQNESNSLGFVSSSKSPWDTVVMFINVDGTINWHYSQWGRLVHENYSLYHAKEFNTIEIQWFHFNWRPKSQWERGYYLTSSSHYISRMVPTWLKIITEGAEF